MNKSIVKVAVAGAMGLGLVFSGQTYAQAALPVVCPDYKKGSTSLPSQRTGKKVQKAFEAYNNDQVQEALEILYDIDTSNKFDRAFTDRFIGNLLASQEGQGKKSLGYLIGAVKDKELNDSEHAGTLRLIGDLSMQEKEYPQAVEYYNKWMDFTCKRDPDVYTRMAQAYYENKQLDKVIDAADKAIALYDKPNKNPYVLKLTSYYDRKMLPQTVDVAETLVKTFPDNKQWWSQLGFFYVMMEDYAKALSTFEMAYSQGYLSKKSEIRTLAQVYATNEIPIKAAEIMEKYIKSGLLDKDAKSYANLANILHQAKELKKAASYYQEAAEISNNPEYFRKQGVLLLAAEDYRGALKALKLALDNGAEDTGRIHFALMEANFYLGNFKQAYAHVKEAKKDSSVGRNARAWEPYIKEKAKNRGINI